MIHFPMLRLRRLGIQMRELGIGQAIAIAEMPAHLHEAGVTAHLRAAIDSVKGIDDPANWTLQERTMAVGHYLACTLEGGPDYAIGDGLFSDYMDGATDYPCDSVDAGELGSDAWTVRQITGGMAESIERVAGDVAKGRFAWLLGSMAAQMLRTGELSPDATESPGEFDAWLVERMRVLQAFAESDFSGLLEMFYAAREKLHHLFAIEFTADGVVALPKGGAELPPARFRADSCISDMAKAMGGKPEGSSG